MSQPCSALNDQNYPIFPFRFFAEYGNVLPLTTASEGRVENSDFTQRPNDDVDKDPYTYLSHSKIAFMLVEIYTHNHKSGLVL